MDNSKDMANMDDPEKGFSLAFSKDRLSNIRVMSNQTQVGLEISSPLGSLYFVAGSDIPPTASLVLAGKPPIQLTVHPQSGQPLIQFTESSKGIMTIPLDKVLAMLSGRL